jgi:DNA-binding response OmpR family regulator
MHERILVVDDEPWVRQMVKTYLEQAGFEVITAATGEEAMTRTQLDKPDLLILDWMLPGLSGLEIAQRVRARSPVPIIMLTARTEEIDRIEGLEAGADDYVVKPFSARELEARVRAVLRRADGSADAPMILESGDLRVDVKERRVKATGEEVDLSPMEFDLLVFLLEHPGRVFTRLELLEALRGTTYESFERSIDSHIKRLRQKIEPDPKRPTRIVTVFGVGYRLAKHEGPE